MCAISRAVTTPTHGRRVLAPCLAAWLLVAPASTDAAPSCRNLGVARPVAFGTYSPFSGATLSATGLVTYDCPPPTAPAISLSGGNSGAPSARYMVSALGDHLAYNLYTDAACRTVWGTVPLPVPGGNGQSVTIYGCVPAWQVVAAGTYADTIWVTINF